MTNALFSGAVPLLIFVAKATLLLVAALLATITLRRSTAGARHLVWLAALVGVLALPLLSRIPVLQLGILPSLSSAAALEVAPPAPAIAGGVGAGVSGGVGSSIAPAVVAESPADSIALIPPTAVNVVSNPMPVLARGFTTPLLSIPTSFLTTVAIVWAGVALSLVAWLIFGAIQVRRIVGNGTELTSPDWTTPLCEVADRLDLEMPPRLVLSDRIEMAFACRALAPTIVLPAAAEGWTDDRRRAVLFHELAHVKRHDLLGHTLGRLACALYWFHPLVWTAAKNLRNESERACDDLVLSCGARPSEYAQHLLDMVTSVRQHGAPVMALPMARKKEFEGRMLAILDPAIRRASPGRLQSALVIASLGALSLTVAAVAPATGHPVHARAPEAARSVAQLPQSAPVQTPRIRNSKGDTIPAPQPRPQPRPDPNVDPQDVADVRANAEAFGKSIAASFTQAFTSQTTQATTDSLTRKLTTRANDQAVGTELSSLVKSATQLGLKTGAEALKHVGDVRAPQADTGRIAMLVKVLSTDSDAGVRRAAAWALKDIQTPGAKSSLVTALKSDADPHVREMSAWALEEHESEDVASALADALVHDKSAIVRGTSAWALGRMGNRGQRDALITATSDADGSVREVAIWSLGQMDLRRAPTTVVNALTDGETRVRTIAAWTLGQIGDSTSARALVRAFETETDRNVRIAELHALMVMDAAPTNVIDAAMRSNDPELRRRGVEMLAGHPTPWPWPWPRPQPRTSP